MMRAGAIRPFLPELVVAQSRRRRHNRIMHPPESSIRSAIAIRRWSDIAHGERLSGQLDAIFFEASGTKSFADENERAAFRERWLGRYLVQQPQWAYVAIAPDGTLAGYLVGAPDEGSGFDDFAAAAGEFPAHLHVNLAPQYRSQGIGGELIEACMADMAPTGVKGVHVVTSVDSRNVRFYERNGFRPRARTTVNGRELVFLGRRLSNPETA
jgi:ribosomal protein S18 acetylase RimI-like enzyme